MKKLWFKARPFGWGWYPSSWEGFGVIAIFGLWIYALFLFAHPEVHPGGWIIGLLGSIPVLTFVTWKTGERPSWRWAGKTVPASVFFKKAAIILAILSVVVLVIVLLI